jgi:hypothetical protein
MRVNRKTVVVFESLKRNHQLSYNNKPDVFWKASEQTNFNIKFIYLCLIVLSLLSFFKKKKNKTKKQQQQKNKHFQRQAPWCKLDQWCFPGSRQNWLSHHICVAIFIFCFVLGTNFAVKYDSLIIASRCSTEIMRTY